MMAPAMLRDLVQWHADYWPFLRYSLVGLNKLMLGRVTALTLRRGGDAEVE